MGGGEGSTAREILRHKTAEKVTMCDIDEVKPPYILLFLCVGFVNVCLKIINKRLLSQNTS